MSDRIYSITSRNRLYTVDDVAIEKVVSNYLIPMVSRYNTDAGNVDYRGLFCTDADTDLIQYDIPSTDRLDLMGPHEVPFYVGDKRGAYQQFAKRYGNAVGFDIEFFKWAKQQDYVDRVAKAMALDKRRIRHNILRDMLAPPEYGHGFWNRTFASMEGISSPPDYGTNTFNANHTHYLTTGTATINDTDIFEDDKQHIREHGEVNGDWVCIMNSNDITALGKLANWYGNSGTIVSNPITDLFAKTGLERDFTLQGINFMSDEWMPSGYYVLLGGLKTSRPVKFHQDKNSQFRGLMWVPGKNDESLGGYPIRDSYFTRIFDARVWNRWQGVVRQVTTSGTYSAPSYYNSE